MHFTHLRCFNTLTLVPSLMRLLLFTCLMVLAPFMFTPVHTYHGTEYHGAYAPPGVRGWGVTCACAFGASSCHLLYWGSCSSASCLGACWQSKSASFAMGWWLAPSVCGRCSSMGSFLSSSVSPAEKLPVSHPSNSFASLAVSHCEASCASDSSWGLREIYSWWA